MRGVVPDRSMFGKKHETAAVSACACEKERKYNLQDWGLDEKVTG